DGAGLRRLSLLRAALRAGGGRQGIRPLMTGYLPKTVMITGATGGFGAAFAKKFAAAGCKLILTSRRQAELDKVAAALKVPVHKVIMDVRERKAIESAFGGLPKDFQEIDLLINNAGGAFGLEPYHQSQLDDIEAMIEANDIGLALCTRLALPGMV